MKGFSRKYSSCVRRAFSAGSVYMFGANFTVVLSLISCGTFLRDVLYVVIWWSRAFAAAAWVSQRYSE